MGSHYGHMSAAGRSSLHASSNAGLSLGAISASAGRARSTLSREVRRNAGTRQGCDAGLAGQAARARVRRGEVKLREGTALRKHVFARIKRARSPQQISGGLRAPPRKASGAGSTASCGRRCRRGRFRRAGLHELPAARGASTRDKRRAGKVAMMPVDGARREGLPSAPKAANDPIRS